MMLALNKPKPPTGIVLFAHGSRDPLWSAPIEAVRGQIEQSHPGTAVRCAYLELCTPDLSQAARALYEAGVRHLTIVPMFLGTGRHAREDLPLLAAALGAQHPDLEVHLQRAVGEDSRMIALMAAIALEGAGD